MIPEVLKDTRSSLLELHYLKSMWMAQESLHLPRFKISAFLNNLKGVRNPPVLYVIIPEAFKDTQSSWLGLHYLKVGEWTKEVPICLGLKFEPTGMTRRVSRTLLSFMSWLQRLSRTLKVPDWVFITWKVCEWLKEVLIYIGLIF